MENLTSDMFNKSSKTSMIIGIAFVVLLIASGYAWYKDRQYTGDSKTVEPVYYKYGSYVIPALFYIILFLGILGGLRYQLNN